MKNIIQILMAVAIFLGFAACEPNEDIYDELPDEDSTTLANIDKMAPMDSYMLTDADYELSSNYSVANYHNFSESAPPKENMPEILNKLFLVEPGAEMEVIYNYYAPLYMGDTIANTTATDTVFYNNNEIYTYLNETQTGEKGDLVVLTYDWEEEANTLTHTFINTGISWHIAYMLQPNDYSEMNVDTDYFDNEGLAAERIPVYLGTFASGVFNYQFDTEGDEAYIFYEAYDDGELEMFVMHLEIMSGSWTIIGSTVSKTGTVIANNESWSFIPAIDFIETSEPHTHEYTLTDEDYELVDNGQYYNFDVRPGANEEPVEVRIEKISTILKTRISDLEIDDIFLVHYDVYTGSAEEWDITLKAVPQ